MAQCCYLVVLLTLSLTSALLYQVSAFTDPSDVLKDLYRELSYSQQLVGWNPSGGDPCEESWKGISCNGSSVIFIKINGLELSGRLGDQLFNLVHLKQLNVSSNHIYGEIPASLPPNATYIDLSFNDFSGNIPYSLTSTKYLRHLNLSHNSLSGPVGNVFTSLQNLKRMDLSNNNFTGDLPTSFQDLKNLTSLFFLSNAEILQDLQQEEDQQQLHPDQQQLQPDQQLNDNGGSETGGGVGAGAGEGGGGGASGAGAGAGEGGEEGGNDDVGEQDGDGEEDEEEEDEDEDEDEEEDDDDDEDDVTDSFCRPDDPKIYGDSRKPAKNKRAIAHFRRKD